MFPELSIERIFRRELDSLPVPDEPLWVPNRRARNPAVVAIVVVSAAFLLAVAALGLIREANGAATQPRGVASPPPTLPARASCVPSAVSANGRCVTFLPNAVRNPAQGYNLTIPANWREAQMPPGTEPFVPDRPNRQISLTAPFLLDRHVFTARSTQEGKVNGDAVPVWDLDVQVWDRQGRTALDWSLTFGPCDHSVVTFGTSACVERTEMIRGVAVIVTTVYNLHGPRGTSYYLERGDQMLILRYWSDPSAASPEGVTEGTLEGIVQSIGLV
jgi:hypothetical protein